MALIPKLPRAMHFLEIGAVVLVVLIVLHMVPKAAFWQRWKPFGSTSAPAA